MSPAHLRPIRFVHSVHCHPVRPLPLLHQRPPPRPYYVPIRAHLVSVYRQQFGSCRQVVSALLQVDDDDGAGDRRPTQMTTM
eukprot:7654676-Pyramimonas_sp.AAC.1